MPIIADKSGSRNPHDIPPPREGILARIPEGILTIVVILVASAGSFGLGILYEREQAPHEELLIEEPTAIEEGSVLGSSLPAAATLRPASAPPPILEGSFVASKKGSKYHFPWCPGAKAMSEENKIYFATREEAEAAGYEPAANCKGL